MTREKDALSVLVDAPLGPAGADEKGLGAGG